MNRFCVAPTITLFLLILNTVATAANDPVAACCYFDEAAQEMTCEMLTENMCLKNNGFWYGVDDVACDSSEVDCDSKAPIGACCYTLADGTLICSLLEGYQCEALGGQWYGTAVVCSDSIVNCDNPIPIGACCYKDAVSGLICTNTTQADCINGFGGIWYGTNVPCSSPVVECGDPIQTECHVAAGSQCAGRPAYSDPDFSQVFGNGQIAVQTASPLVFGGSVVMVFDLSGVGMAPLDSWFALNRYTDPSWTAASLGGVFGVAVDDDGDIYVTSTASWNHDYVGFGGLGAVYRLDRVTGAVSVFATLPNSGSALGSITYDCDHGQFFVSNLEDGLIYRLDTAGTLLDAFDPFLPYTGVAGPVSLGDRPWAVEVHNGRLFYSMWNQDWGYQTNGMPNEIRSVLLDGSGAPVGAEQLEITLPPLPLYNFSCPVADIRFSTQGTMLLAERSMSGYSTLTAHQSRVLEYECVNNVWFQTSSVWGVGVFQGTNATGGVDADLNRVWVGADAMHFGAPAPGTHMYGIQGLPVTGGSVTDSVLIDYQDNMTGTDKMMLGDLVVTPSLPNNCVTPHVFDVTCRLHHYNGQYHRLGFGFSNMVTQDISQVELTGPAGVTISPSVFVGPYPPNQSYVEAARLFGTLGMGGQTLCLTMTMTLQDGSMCTDELCFVVPQCPPILPGDVNFDERVDVSDLLSIIDRWGDSCGDDEDCPQDLDGDGEIGIGDLLIVLENWTD